MGAGDGRRRIEVVEVAIDGQMVVAKGLISVGDVEGGVRRVGGPGDDVRTGAGIIRVMQGEGGHADAGCLRVLPQQIGVQTVRAEYQRLRVDDDLALAIQVILERGVFDRADVVGGDVEERGHIESQAIDAVHLVRLGGCLLYTSKQVEEYLGVLEPILSSVVVTENSWRERVMPADELEKIAVDVFGRDRVIKEANLPDAIQTAVNMVDAEDELGVGYGHGVLICGSFVTAGDARLMLEEHASPTMRQAMAVHQPAVDPDDSDQPADKAEDEAADNLEDSVSPDDFDVFDVLGLGKEQAGDAGNAGTGTASADTGAVTDDSADVR